MRIRVKDQKGFTLLEVLISIVILSVALLAIAGLQIISIRGNSFGGTMTEAVTLARDKIEDLKRDDWANVNTDYDLQVVRGINYARNWAVQLVGQTKEVTVTVSWDNGNHQVSLATTLAGRASPSLSFWWRWFSASFSSGPSTGRSPLNRNHIPSRTK
jgi:prepilin-type N-terminal cleavage/methylation domain-containing protein